jgi:hypothetical protein
MPDDFINQSQLVGAAAVACSELILPSKPFVVFVSIGLTSGEVDEHLPA